MELSDIVQNGESRDACEGKSDIFGLLKYT